MHLPKATAMAHQLVGARLESGEIAVDATAGNGHDTVFLAESVGADGKVFAVDIQAGALEETAAKLDEAELRKRVKLCEGSHCDLRSIVPAKHHGKVAIVMFNLGYLPGGDKSITTHWETTIPALKAALELLRVGGVLTVVCYPGHAAGAEEANAVSRWVGMLDQVDFRAVRYGFENVHNAPPFLFAIEKM